jgi:hypothetical protein
VTRVFPTGAEDATKGRARDLIESFVVTDGVSATRPARVKIDGKRGFSTDLTTLDGRPLPLFANDATTFVLEPGRTTRVVALDVGKATLVIAIGPSRDSSLDALLDTADDVAGSIRFR